MDKEPDRAEQISRSAAFRRLERKTAAGMPAAVRTMATGLLSRGHSKSIATGLTRTRGRFDYLYALREEHQRIERIR